MVYAADSSERFILMYAHLDGYAPGLSDAEKKLTIGALLEKRLGGRAEYADRVTLGPIELIVRDVDDNGKVTALGLSFEPVATSPRIPVFLSAGEIGDRLRRLVVRMRKPAPPAEAGPQDDDMPGPAA